MIIIIAACEAVRRHRRRRRGGPRGAGQHRGDRGHLLAHPVDEGVLGLQLLNNAMNVNKHNIA